MTNDDIAEALQAMNECLERAGQAFSTFMEQVYEAFQKTADVIVTMITDDDFIQKLIDWVKSWIKQQEKPKYDKNIRHFKSINKTYKQPCYKIRPTARTHCR